LNAKYTFYLGLTIHSIAVGLCIGFIFGATNIIRYGPGPQGMMRTLGQYMLGSAATFGYEGYHVVQSMEVSLTLLQILHVHRHNHSNRELANRHRSIPLRSSTKRTTDDHAVGSHAEENGQGAAVRISRGESIDTCKENGSARIGAATRLQGRRMTHRAKDGKRLLMCIHRALSGRDIPSSRKTVHARCNVGCRATTTFPKPCRS
jgi:hypothetical protein